MADDVLKTHAENKVKELEKEEQRLERELRGKESFHRAAWAEYGSELCSGEMLADEDAIRDDIAEVGRKISLLKKFVGGKLDISREERLRNNSAEVAAQIVILQDSKKLIDGELSEIVMVKNLLAVTF